MTSRRKSWGRSADPEQHPRRDGVLITEQAPSWGVRRSPPAAHPSAPAGRLAELRLKVPTDDAVGTLNPSPTGRGAGAHRGKARGAGVASPHGRGAAAHAERGTDRAAPVAADVRRARGPRVPQLLHRHALLLRRDAGDDAGAPPPCLRPRRPRARSSSASSSRRTTHRRSCCRRSAGALADKVSMRNILIVAAGLMAVFAGVTAVGVAMDVLDWWHVMVIGVLPGVGHGVHHADAPGHHRHAGGRASPAECDRPAHDVAERQPDGAAAGGGRAVRICGWRSGRTCSSQGCTSWRSACSSSSRRCAAQGPRVNGAEAARRWKDSAMSGSSPRSAR